MKKVIKLTESDLQKIVQKVLNEQSTASINPKNLKFGDRGEDVKKLQQRLIDMKVLRLNAPTGYFGPITQRALARAEGKPVPTTTPKSATAPKQELSVCPSVGNSPYFRDLSGMVAAWKKQYPNFKSDQEVISFIDRMINRDAQAFKQTVRGISQQGACQVASISRRPQYDNKSVFIIDSPNKRIFLFSAKDKNQGRTLIAQDILIDGKQKQRNDVVSVAKSFQTYGEKWKELKKELKREPTEDEVWAAIDKDGTRFLPAGIYQGGETKTYPKYTGGQNNLLIIRNWMGKEVGQALHGYYAGDSRAPFMEKALSIVKNPNDPKQIENFANEMRNKGLKMDFSFGCINLPPRFVKYLQQYGPGSFIFNIAEDNNNYLVQNTENYFDKMQNSESCPSPKSLGAVDINSMA
jgi:peptidoglycan hydrolase-like protein with peptidoglycan-binding domain